MNQESRFIDVNGLRMHVVAAGSGPAVLLLHGFPDTHHVWRKQIGTLAQAGYHVIAPDLRGYGKTDAPGDVEAYELDKLRADVIGVLDAFGIDKARVVGHDWGGIIGWELCMYSASRVLSYVAMSTGHPMAIARAGITQKLRMFYVLGFLMPGLAEHALRAHDWFVLRKATRDEDQIGYWRDALEPPGRLTAALNYYRANARAAMRRRWPPVKTPVMGIWSDHDPALGEAQMRGSAHYVYGSFRFERIRGADHWLQLTAPDRINALLLEFFRSAPTIS